MRMFRTLTRSALLLTVTASLALVSFSALPHSVAHAASPWPQFVSVSMQGHWDNKPADSWDNKVMTAFNISGTGFTPGGEVRIEAYASTPGSSYEPILNDTWVAYATKAEFSCSTTIHSGGCYSNPGGKVSALVVDFGLGCYMGDFYLTPIDVTFYMFDVASQTWTPASEPVRIC